MDAETFAREHKEYLQNNRPDVLKGFQREGDLSRYLSSIGEQAESRMIDLHGQMNKQAGVNDLPYLQKVAALQNHHQSALEIVRDEIILQPRD